MSSPLTDTDRGYTALLARAKTLAEGRRVRVGVLDDGPKREADGDSSKLSLLEVAAIHEFGAPGAGIPQRSFIRATVDARRSEIEAIQRALALQVLAGKLTPEAAYELLGAKVAAMVQNRIAEGIGPSLKPETVDRKGSSTPLIDTGQLRSSITYAVVAGDH